MAGWMPRLWGAPRRRDTQRGPSAGRPVSRCPPRFLSAPCHPARGHPTKQGLALTGLRARPGFAPSPVFRSSGRLLTTCEVNAGRRANLTRDRAAASPGFEPLRGAGGGAGDSAASTRGSCSPLATRRSITQSPGATSNCKAPLERAGRAASASPASSQGVGTRTVTTWGLLGWSASP